MNTEDLHNPQNNDWTYVHSDDLDLVLNVWAALIPMGCKMLNVGLGIGQPIFKSKFLKILKDFELCNVWSSLFHLKIV